MHCSNEYKNHQAIIFIISSILLSFRFIHNWFLTSCLKLRLYTLNYFVVLIYVPRNCKTNFKFSKQYVSCLYYTKIVLYYISVVPKTSQMLATKWTKINTNKELRPFLNIIEHYHLLEFPTSTQLRKIQWIRMIFCLIISTTCTESSNCHANFDFNTYT